MTGLWKTEDGKSLVQVVMLEAQCHVSPHMVKIKFEVVEGEPLTLKYEPVYDVAMTGIPLEKVVRPMLVSVMPRRKEKLFFYAMGMAERTKGEATVIVRK